jgi:signal transduction protein with GAF and PtsI domain
VTGGTGRRAEALSAIIAAAGSTTSVDDVLEAVVRELGSEDASFVYLLDDAGDHLVLRAASAPYDRLVGSVALDRGTGFAWLAVERREAVMVERPASDPRTAHVSGIDEAAFGASLAAPMIARDGGVLGVVTVSVAAHAVFDEEDADFLVSATTVAAAAVDNARLPSCRSTVATDRSACSLVARSADPALAEAREPRRHRARGRGAAGPRPAVRVIQKPHTPAELAERLTAVLQTPVA